MGWGSVTVNKTLTINACNSATETVYSSMNYCSEQKKGFSSRGLEEIGISLHKCWKFFYKFRDTMKEHGIWNESVQMWCWLVFFSLLECFVRLFGLFLIFQKSNLFSITRKRNWEAIIEAQRVTKLCVLTPYKKITIEVEGTKFVSATTHERTFTLILNTLFQSHYFFNTSNL